MTNSGETGKNFSSGWSQMTGAHFSVKSRASLLTSPATKLSMNVDATSNIENKVNFIVNTKVTTDDWLTNIIIESKYDFSLRGKAADKINSNVNANKDGW